MTVGTCPACGSAYAPRAETCPACGEPLSSVARMITASTARRQPLWLDQNRQLAGDIRKRETTAADERMASLVEVDQRRIETEQALAARTADRERRAILLAGGLFAVIALLTAIVVLTILF
jgi:hypothetical protein